MNHLVLIADIIASRNLDDRSQTQEQLAAVLSSLNSDSTQLASPYTVTLGDEFQAVFSGADRIFPDIFTIMHAMHPVELRFALGIGSIDTAINPDRAIGMDGPAFHGARDLLSQMKRENRVLDLTGLAPDDGLLNAALGVLNHQLRKWQPNRFEVLQCLLRDWEIGDIARHLSISEQGVYKNIRDGALESVIQMLRAITQRLNNAI